MIEILHKDLKTSEWPVEVAFFNLINENTEFAERLAKLPLDITGELVTRTDLHRKFLWFAINILFTCCG